MRFLPRVVLVTVLVACDRGHGEPVDLPPPNVHVVPVRGWTSPADAANAPSDGARTDDETVDLVQYGVARPRSGKSIGHTSVVFKFTLEGGLVAAYKPASKRGPARYKAEIAAYRLGRALGLPNVPPAIPRAFAKGPLLAALGGPSSEAGALLAAEGIVDDHGRVNGAIIPWIPHLTFVALEADPLLSEWKRWLAGTLEIPPTKRRRASDISTMIVFDYLTANWDRWSGGNVGEDAAHESLLFIDNDAAFYEAPPEGRLAAQRARLEGVLRFSRSLVGRLRGLDRRRLGVAMGDETPGTHLLSDHVLDAVDARRTDALSLVDAQIAKLGETTVLAFE